MWKIQAYNCRLEEHWKGMLFYQTTMVKAYTNNCGYNYKAISETKKIIITVGKLML